VATLDLFKFGQTIFFPDLTRSEIDSWYGVAMLSRIDKIIGLFCRISSLL